MQKCRGAEAQAAHLWRQRRRRKQGEAAARTGVAPGPGSALHAPPPPPRPRTSAIATLSPCSLLPRTCSLLHLSLNRSVTSLTLRPAGTWPRWHATCLQYPYFVQVRFLDAFGDILGNKDQYWPYYTNQNDLPYYCGGVLINPPAGGAHAPAAQQCGSACSTIGCMQGLMSSCGYPTSVLPLAPLLAQASISLCWQVGRAELGAAAAAAGRWVCVASSVAVMTEFKPKQATSKRQRNSK